MLLEIGVANSVHTSYTIGQGCGLCDVSGLLWQNKGLARLLPFTRMEVPRVRYATWRWAFWKG